MGMIAVKPQTENRARIAVLPQAHGEVIPS